MFNHLVWPKHQEIDYGTNVDLFVLINFTNQLKKIKNNESPSAEAEGGK